MLFHQSICQLFFLTYAAVNEVRLNLIEN